MSAEAADRVAAVISSRPSTPLQISWFEFLLDNSLLEKHLQKPNAGQHPDVFYDHYHSCLFSEIHCFGMFSLARYLTQP